ncbi:MAG: bifunctional UDP-N-acetylmuramoyl-tripeptide:D-alanyl-D-alanine ligase/alanine racemase [Bacteroidaceae bacterium]|nr:bifunctional UDP-N-acetylmuramoyl-tripeptide:D-alanyl-D-alanine ligase/alanine racemase [Bacteroidaceae bacterium]
MNYNTSQIATIIKAAGEIHADNNLSVLLTDSRSLTFPEESIFFALVTERNDGHKYIKELYDKGVRDFVIDHYPIEADQMPEANFLRVANTLAAMQMLAAHHRRQFDIPVIGITGSNGKTSVKEWLHQLLQDDYNIVRSPRSYNSQTGVPLSVWQLNEKTELALFEAGISRPDEMNRLEEIIQPTIGLITNIGEAHQEGFASIQQKCIEKLTLLQGCDCIIYDGDNEIVSDCVEKLCLGAYEIAWSRKDRDKPLYISSIEKGDHTTRIKYTYLQYMLEVTIPYTDDASIQNAIHCLAIMLYLNRTPEVISERMAKLEPLAMRMEVKEGNNNCLIINDSYNSDMDSLTIALDFQARRAASSNMKRTLILSDIFQTGLPPATLYRKVSELLKRKGIERLIGIGPIISDNAYLFDIEKEFYSGTREFVEQLTPDMFHNELILIKGARDFHFELISEALELKQHETILEVNLDALIDNLNYYKSYLKPETKVVCMVKAFGYGAGSYEIAKTLQDRGADYLAVAVADEGAELRKAGITMPIIVMNPEMSSFRTLFSYRLEPEIYSFNLLNALLAEGEKLGVSGYPIHIKIDSGMHRLGFTENQIDELAGLLQSQIVLMARSVFSHLAGSDEAQHDGYTLQQAATFNRCADKIQAASKHKVMRHLLNTAGITRFSEYQADMVRLGIGLYGVSPIDENQGLRPVSTLKTTILQIHEYEAGETIGYGRHGVLTRHSRIAAIPIGYADGLDRHLGNGNCEVLINGHRAPIVGNICMDICMIDVTDIACNEGDRVEIFGENLPVQELAQRLDTIPYEVLTSISNRVKRVYYRE